MSQSKSNQQTQCKHKSGNPTEAENTKAQLYKLYSMKQNEDENTCAESTHKGVNYCLKDIKQTQPQRPKSPI